MGAGKTEVGRRVARALGRKFVDTDVEIERSTGRKIRDIFEKDGEAAFRRIEAGVIAKIADMDGLVIAAGGGVVTHRDNTRLLKSNGIIFYLKAGEKTLKKRLEGDIDRPLIQKDPEGSIKTLLAKRSNLYKEAADITIDTIRSSIDEVVRKVLDALDERHIGRY